MKVDVKFKMGTNITESHPFKENGSFIVDKETQELFVDTGDERYGRISLGSIRLRPIENPDGTQALVLKDVIGIPVNIFENNNNPNEDYYILAIRVPKE